MSLTFLWCFPIIRSGGWDLSGVVHIFGGCEGVRAGPAQAGSEGPVDPSKARTRISQEIRRGSWMGGYWLGCARAEGLVR